MAQGWLKKATDKNQRATLELPLINRQDARARYARIPKDELKEKYFQKREDLAQLEYLQSVQDEAHQSQHTLRRGGAVLCGIAGGTLVGLGAGEVTPQPEVMLAFGIIMLLLAIYQGAKTIKIDFTPEIENARTQLASLEQELTRRNVSPNELASGYHKYLEKSPTDISRVLLAEMEAADSNKASAEGDTEQRPTAATLH